MTWAEFSATAAVGFGLGMSLGLLTLSVHLARKGLTKITQPLGGGSL